MPTYTNALIGHFLAGVWIAVAVRKGITLPPVVATLAVLAGTAALYFIPWGGALVTLACGLASTAIVAGVVSMDLRGSVPNVAILLFSGNASYSIYLWHGFALSLVAKVAVVLGLPGWLTTAAGVLGGIVCGMIVYLIVEKQVKNLLSRRKPRQLV